jgi:hypothetical protein
VLSLHCPTRGNEKKIIIDECLCVCPVCPKYQSLLLLLFIYIVSYLYKQLFSSLHRIISDIKHGGMFIIYHSFIDNW